MNRARMPAGDGADPVAPSPDLVPSPDLAPSPLNKQAPLKTRGVEDAPDLD